jgi:S-sulfo-L-cysteine synthase (O-acetyl-L-serine-dependent)
MNVNALKKDHRFARKSDIVSLVGNTPLVRLTKLFNRLDTISVSAKLEWFNPGGSVKDRPALNMIWAGERSGELTPEKIIIDATSGNTGIAYAMFGAALGYKVTLALPGNAGIERKKMLKALGADLIITDPMEGTDGAIRTVQELVREYPDRYFYPDQYNNEANWKSHYDTTATEILRDTNGDITHFVAGLGTTGTFTGVARRLKKTNDTIRCIAVQPDSPLHAIEGWKHLPTAMVPGIYDESLVDDLLEVTTEEAHAFVRKTATEEGLLIGVSSGAVLAAVHKLLDQLQSVRPLRKPRIVTVLPDGAEKYFSELFWDE